MEIKFNVLGEPQGKARPRMSFFGGKIRVYTPKKTVDYERTIRSAYKNAIKHRFEKGVPLEITIEAFTAPPKRTSKKLLAEMIEGKIFPTKKPDIDNIQKAILDALNGVAFFDDSQICDIRATKRYALVPRVKITIKESKTDIAQMLKELGEKIKEAKNGRV